MSKKHLIGRNYQELRSKMRATLTGTKRINELYPAVTLIHIDYHTIHYSAFGVIKKEHSIQLKPDFLPMFFIDCPNTECTGIGFNLSHIISQMIIKKQIECSGTLQCNGKEADDHLEQTCNSILNYTVHIEYTI